MSESIPDGYNLIEDTDSDGKSQNTNGDIIGTDGNDYIIAGPDDEVFRRNSAGKEILVQDNDIITGGPGDDIMKGGYGNDTFVFKFTISAPETKSFTFEDWSKPNEHANLQAWENAYDSWVAYLETLGTVDFGTHDGEPIKVGWSGKSKSFTQTFDKDQTATVTTSGKVDGDGYDQILDFGNGKDMLKLEGLSGITEDTFSELFDVVGNETQTILSWAGGSITINGLVGLGSDAAFFSYASDNGWFA